jgi:hypothetical protein
MKKLPILLGVIAISGLAIATGLGTTSAQQPPPDRIFAPAPIESIDVIPSGSAPTGHALHIVAGLPNGCAEPDDTGFYRDGNNFYVSVTNTVPADPSTICTQIYRTYETVVDLGTDFVPGDLYTAYVNGRPFSFIAHGGIVPPDQTLAPAPIESIDVSATLSLPPQYVAHIVAGLPGGCAEPAAHNVWRGGNTITIDVLNFMPSGDQVCTDIYGTYPVDVNLGSDFVSGETYTVDANGTVATFTAY